MAELKELYADSVQFNYPGGQDVLTGAYLKCRVGEIVGLLGRNGSGKSTLMKIVFGALKPRHSYILLNGKKVEKAYLTRKIGYLPQHSFLPTHEKTATLIRLFVEDGSEREALYSDVRMKTLLDRKMHQLSGGELRYLEICLLLCQPTDFVLLDEPFSGIEPMYVEHITEMILHQRDRKGFVISDHSYQPVLDIATGIVLLENGCCRPIHHKRELEFFYVPDGTFGKPPR